MKFTQHPERQEIVVRSVEAGGHEYVENLDDAEFLIFHGAPEDFPDPLPPNIKFVQTQMAGIDTLHEAGIPKRSGVRWANAAGLYDDTVAESCLALLLAVNHQHKRVGMAASFDVREEVEQRTRFLTPDMTVAVVGCGGIGRHFLKLIAPFGTHTIAVTRSGRVVDEASESTSLQDFDWSIPDVFVVLLPLTDETRGLIDASVLSQMKDSAVIVNAGRGGLIVTDDLVDALKSGEIAGAGLDVMDPEPLPDGHPLWSLENCVITPHTANTLSNVRAKIGGLAAKNADLFAGGDQMLTEVDIDVGY